MSVRALAKLCCVVAASCSVLPTHANGFAKAVSGPAIFSVKANANNLEILRELSASFEEITRRAGQSVVQIFARTFVPPDSETGAPSFTSENSTASGVIVSADGCILTNAHAIRGAHSIRVQMIDDDRPQSNSRRYHSLTAAVVGIDFETDLAVIKVNAASLPYLTFGDSDRLKQGQLVLALGNPMGLENSVSLGVVSAVARQLSPDDSRVYIQTDAPINPGNSGGPLLDADGRVVGINTFIFSRSGGSEGIGFAIPSSIARQVYLQLKTQGHVHRARLGLVAQTIDPTMIGGLDLTIDHGVIVSDVDPEGPAAAAGIKSDDVITALNGNRILTASQLEANVSSQPPGTVATLRVRRGEDRLEVPVKTGEELDELHNLADTLDPVVNTISQLGVVGLDIAGPVLKIISDLRRPEGVMVAVRNPEIPYSGRPLQVGDAIYEINRRVIANVAEARKVLDRMKPGDPVVLLIEREGHLLYVPLELN